MTILILVLSLLLLTFIGSVFLMKSYSAPGIITDLFAPISAMLSILGMVCWIGALLLFIGSTYKADIINKEFNTSYTAAEVFYAEDVIDEIRQIKRQRVEINGNLITGDKND